MCRRFSCGYGYLHCPLARRLAVLSGVGRPTPLQPSIPYDGGSVTPRSRQHPRRGLRNIDRICIACPIRVRLSSRLTLIRITLIRKPWAFGVDVHCVHCRYSCLHFRFRTLQRDSRRAFNADRNAPLPHAHFRTRTPGFGGGLHARSSSARVRSTSELLRTL